MDLENLATYGINLQKDSTSRVESMGKTVDFMMESGSNIQSKLDKQTDQMVGTFDDLDTIEANTKKSSKILTRMIRSECINNKIASVVLTIIFVGVLALYLYLKFK